MTEPGAFGSHVLIVGDPRRAELIATELLDDARLVCDARGLPGWAGAFGGKRVGVQAHGVGGPSAALVVEELERELDTRRRHAGPLRRRRDLDRLQHALPEPLRQPKRVPVAQLLLRVRRAGVG